MEPRNAIAGSKEKRAYGKAPLDLDLPQALEILSKISQEGKSMPESRIAIVLGNTVTSSAFKRKIRALSVYGLLAEQTDGHFGLTNLALAIALPGSLQTQAESKKQAFLRIDQFRFLFNQHKGKLLPADEFLRNILEQECGIPRENSHVWVKQFKDGARAAGIFHNRDDGKVQIAESIISVAMEIPPQQLSGRSADTVRIDGDGSHSLAEVRHIESQSSSITISASGHCTRIDLSDGRRAEIIIPDKITIKDAKKLKKALEGVSLIIDSMISEEEIA